MPDEAAGALAPPRAPARSWVDVLIEAAERAPGPWWLPWAALAAMLLTVEGALAWAGGTPPTAFAAYFAVAGIYALALVQHLARASARACEAFERSVPREERPRFDGLRAQLGSLPAGPAAMVGASAIGLSVAALLSGGPLEEQVRTTGLATTSVALPLHLLLYAGNYAATGALLYRVWRQSRVVDQLYRIARVDLLHPRPLHAFAWLGAQSVVGLAIMFYAPVLLLPGVGGEITWALRIVIGLILGALFLWPLLGVHRLLAAERDRRLGRSLDRWRDLYDGFHERLAQGDPGMDDATKNELDALEREQKVLRSISTWPWSAEVIPTVVAAIVLPLMLSLLVAIVQAVVPD